MIDLPTLRVRLGGILSISICFYFLPGRFLGFARDAQPTIEILETEVAEHRIGTRGPIYTNLGQGQPAVTLAPVNLEVVVGTDGKARDATKVSGFIFGDLTLLWKTWQYKPFERNGHTAVAKVHESVTVQRSEVHTPCPEIHGWNSLRITLSRSGCYGTCSSYEVEIHGDATVWYDGKAFVGTTGVKRAKISQSSLVKLVDAFRKADYFSLAVGYVQARPTYRRLRPLSPLMGCRNRCWIIGAKVSACHPLSPTWKLRLTSYPEFLNGSVANKAALIRARVRVDSASASRAAIQSSKYYPRA